MCLAKGEIKDSGEQSTALYLPVIIDQSACPKLKTFNHLKEFSWPALLCNCSPLKESSEA